MRKFVITEDERARILSMHESATKRHYLNEQDTAPTLPNGLKQDNPDSVTIKQVRGDGTNLITFNKNGTFKSTLPMQSGNPKSTSGTWKVNSKAGSQFGGGYIDYYVGGYNVLSQELNSDIAGNDALSELISTNKPAYAKLPVMTKLANLATSNYTVPGQGGEGQSAQVAGAKTPGCPAGCIKDPNYTGTPQKWAPVNG